MTPSPREREDAETAAMRIRLQQLQAELERLRQAIEEHFTRLNAAASSTRRDGTDH